MHEKYHDVYGIPATEFDYDNLNSSFTSSDGGVDDVITLSKAKTYEFEHVSKEYYRGPIQ